MENIVEECLEFGELCSGIPEHFCCLFWGNVCLRGRRTLETAQDSEGLRRPQRSQGRADSWARSRAPFSRDQHLSYQLAWVCLSPSLSSRARVCLLCLHPASFPPSCSVWACGESLPSLACSSLGLAPPGRGLQTPA